MAKKMTAKDFRQAIEQAGFHWDIWGYEGMLNLISSGLKDMAERDSMRGSIHIAQHEMNQSKILYDILDKRGYYK